MVDFDFYQSVYQGGNITAESDFRELSREAVAVLERYKRIYTVTPLTDDGEGMAICAMADALHRVRMAQTGGVVKSSTIGSVSTSYEVAAVDTTPRGVNMELYRCACLYLDICRGVC